MMFPFMMIVGPPCPPPTGGDPLRAVLPEHVPLARAGAEPDHRLIDQAAVAVPVVGQLVGLGPGR